MRLSKAVWIGFVCVIGCLPLVGCQGKKSDTHRAAETSVGPAQTQDQPSTADVAPAVNPQAVVNEQQPVDAAEMNQPVKETGQNVAAGSTEQLDEDEKVSVGRMMEGLFRATRSLVPLPASASGARQTEPADEAPVFPQQ